MPDLLSSIDWTDILQRLASFIQDHWLKALGALALTILSATWTYILAWRRWQSRHDLDVLHISQNNIELRPTGDAEALERWLILDVHSENPLSQDITHPIPCRLIRKAATKTTEHQPFLHFEPHDRWYVLNIVRLAIAEPFKVGAAAKMSKKARVDVVECVFALTYERYTEMRQGKLRIMLIEKSVLDDPQSFTLPLRFESPFHEVRVHTLRKMQADYKRGHGHWEYCELVRINIPLGALA